MDQHRQGGIVVAALFIVFAGLFIAFSVDLLGKPYAVRQLPPVDPEFLETGTWRKSYADLVRAEEDLDAFDCYVCHEEDVRLELKFDTDGQVVIPDEHSDIEMGHGAHGRNNNCFNCHDDGNLLRLQARGGRGLKFEESSELCGSCHGPTKEDWDAGAHGRISGHWNRELGERSRLDCVNCHDPHSPRFPGHKPAPPPNHLRERGAARNESPSSH